eukprot:scaffold10909_cov172-Amphora_coffeaeformis.AAC.4
MLTGEKVAPKQTRSSLLYFQERKRQWAFSPRRRISDLPPIVGPSPVKTPSPRCLGARSRRLALASSSPIQSNMTGTPTFDPSATSSSSSQTSFAFSSKPHPPTSSDNTPAKESSSHKNNSAEQSSGLVSDTKQASIKSPQMPPFETISTTAARSESNSTPGGSFAPTSQSGVFISGSPVTIKPSALNFPQSSEKANAFGSQPKESSNPIPFSSFGIDTTKKPFSESDSGIKTAAPSLFGFSSFASTTPGFSSLQTGAKPSPFSNIGESTAVTESKTTLNSHRDRLVAFYEKHNVAKVGEVDITLEKYRGREEELFTKLSQKYATYPKASGDGPQYILNTTLGPIVVRVFANVVPMAAANFGSLCLGRPVPPANRSNIKSYENTPWHRVVPGQLIQGGDTTVGNGTGGRSAFDQPLAHDMWGHFNDEEFLAHDRAGLLSMANTGKHSNSSQFFITCKPLPNLNGKHVVFGEVTKGMDVVNAICSLEIDAKQCPKKEMLIIDCGLFEENGKEGYSQSDECRSSEVDHDTTSQSSVCEEKKIQHSHEAVLVFTDIPLSRRPSDGLKPKEVESDKPLLHHKETQHQEPPAQIAKPSSVGNHDTVRFPTNNTLGGASILTGASEERQPVNTYTEATPHKNEHAEQSEPQYAHAISLFPISLDTGTNNCSFETNCEPNFTTEVKQTRSEALTLASEKIGFGIEKEGWTTISPITLRIRATADQNDSGTGDDKDAKASLLALGFRQTTMENHKCAQAQSSLRFPLASDDPIVLPLFVATGFTLLPKVYAGETLDPLPRRISGAISGAITPMQEGRNNKKTGTVLNKDGVPNTNTRISIGVLTYENLRINAKRRVSAGSQAEYLAVDPLAVRLCLALMKQR